MKYNVLHFEEIDSTNVEAVRRSEEGAREGLVLVAERQTAGRGRRGRSWESPARENLYFSILLNPRIASEKAPMITLVMAYSIANVLRDELEVQIKWPNDLVVSGKKICGILTEMHMAGSNIKDVVIGVGLNVNTMCFPKDLQDKATSIRLETGRERNREELLMKVLSEFEKHYQLFLQVQDMSFLKEEFNRLLINRNKEVVVLEPSGEFQAEAIGINNLGELLVKKASGDIEAVFAGEVSVRGLYGYV